MTLEELSATLPNGLHDAHVGSLHLDFEGRTAIFEMSVWIGDNSEPEAHRAARLELTNLQFCVIEAPDRTYRYAAAAPSWISDVSPSDLTLDAHQKLSGVFASRFFVNQWNAFVHVAACDAVLVWL